MELSRQINACIISTIIISLVLSVNAEDSKKVHAGRIPVKLKVEKENQNGIVPPELNDLEPEHKILYLRAINGDYDFAKFGEECQVLTLEEKETFLKILEEYIQVSENERDIHERISPAEKGIRLEKLFKHSKTICDHRNLLTCHKNHRTCVCAHPSMGMGSTGVCGVNIGHICEFSERTLQKYGILLTPQTSPIKCLLENAECVMDSTTDIQGGEISPIRKICKCIKGFWGATCRRRGGEDMGHYLQNQPQQRIGPSKPKIKKEISKKSKENDVGGRAIWSQEIGGSSMHPEEIKERLIKIMEEQQMYSPTDRDKKADELLKALEQDGDKEEMVINDMNLRDLARLNLGDSCEPERQIILDTPPVAKDGQRWADPNPDDIKSWQLGLLQDKKPFCNIYKHFRCDATARVCQCKNGLAPDPISKGLGTCVIPLGYNCGPDFDPIMNFDPLKDRKRFSESAPPNCIYKTECKEEALFFEKKCWCKAGEICESPFNMDMFRNQVKAIKSRLMLDLGDPCDPKLHQQLLSYGSSIDPGFENRIKLFQEIVENPENRFCDIGNYLNCSETSRTCQCWKQLRPNMDSAMTEDGINQCVATNMAPCGKTFEYGKYLYDDGSQLWQVEKAFNSFFRPQCIPKAYCAGGDDLQWAGRCICSDTAKTGEMCEDKKAVLATSFKAAQIPNTDDDEMALIRVFFDLNQQTNLLEQLMTLRLNDQCDPDMGLNIDRVVKFWKEIGSSDHISSPKERRTLKHFVAMTKWTKYLVNTAEGNTAALCNVTQGLRCHRMTGACGCVRGTRWVGDKCFVDVDEPCDPKPGAEWLPTCIQGTKCLSVRRNDLNNFKCIPCPEDRKDCMGSDNDERIFDTWDGYADHVVRGRSHGTEDEGYRNVTKVYLKKPGGEDGKYFTLKGFLAGFQSQNTKKEEDKENKRKEFRLQGRNLLDEPLRPRKSDEGIVQKIQASKNVPNPDLGQSMPRNVQNVKKDEPLTPHQRQLLMKEIKRMLNEIVSQRTLTIGKSCDRSKEEELNKIFPALPRQDFNSIVMNIQTVHSVLTKLFFNEKLKFCDRKQFLSCTLKGKCDCSEASGLIKEGGECKLKENKYCSFADEDALARNPQDNQKKKYPSFRCRNETKCTKVDPGLPVCKLIKSEETSTSTQPTGNTTATTPNSKSGCGKLMNSLLILIFTCILLS